MFDRSPPPPDGPGGRRPHGLDRLSLRASLLLVVMVPMLGLGVLSAEAAVRSSSEHSASARVEQEAIALADIIRARTLVADEEVASVVLALGADLGADAEQLSELYGIDYAAMLAAARTAVDDDPVLSSRPELASSLDHLRALRPAIDAGNAGLDRVRSVLLDLTAHVDALWLERFDQREELADRSLPSAVNDRLEVLHSTFLVMSTGSDRVAIATLVLLGDPTSEDARQLIDANTRFDLAVESFSDRLGPQAEARWRAHLASPGSQRFEATLDEVTTVALTGEPSPLSGDPAAFGDAFIDGHHRPA